MTDHDEELEGHTAVHGWPKPGEEMRDWHTYIWSFQDDLDSKLPLDPAGTFAELDADETVMGSWEFDNNVDVTGDLTVGPGSVFTLDGAENGVYTAATFRNTEYGNGGDGVELVLLATNTDTAPFRGSTIRNMRYDEGGTLEFLIGNGNDTDELLTLDGENTNVEVPNSGLDVSGTVTSGGDTVATESWANSNFNDYTFSESYTDLSDVPSTFTPETHGDGAHSEDYAITDTNESFGSLETSGNLDVGGDITVGTYTMIEDVSGVFTGRDTLIHNSQGSNHTRVRVQDGNSLGDMGIVVDGTTDNDDTFDDIFIATGDGVEVPDAPLDVGGTISQNGSAVAIDGDAQPPESHDNSAHSTNYLAASDAYSDSDARSAVSDSTLPGALDMAASNIGTDGSAIGISSSNNNFNVWEISDGFGFRMFYRGQDSGNDNSLELFSESEGRIWEILQDGTINFDGSLNEAGEPVATETYADSAYSDSDAQTAVDGASVDIDGSATFWDGYEVVVDDETPSTGQYIRFEVE